MPRIVPDAEIDSMDLKSLKAYAKELSLEKVSKLDEAKLRSKIRENIRQRSNVGNTEAIYPSTSSFCAAIVYFQQKSNW
ncbi:hypothetical protein BT96DRAFT_914957 [Gymnopus androsaceus JB14]|uniref:Rho termination factor N-terminal domain-containing protein n=1 Tax=Gymnopus androsaceus JB14 TaxID=1447944 RepID=A0A6A4IAQ5_9AGAR|nr:hypothetical protein BT96DRAFT_914957 [Gymnopus androsaceus JB14]